MKKRIMSILLAGMMVCSSIPVYAADDLAAYADVSDSADPEEAAGSDAPAEVAESAGTAESEETEIFSDDGFSDGETAIENTDQADTFSQPEAEDTEVEIAGEESFSDGGAAQAEGTIVSGGTLATGVKWELFDNGNLAFSGSGAIEKDNGHSYPWDSAQVHSITIGNGITGIGSGAFASCTKLTKVAVAADTLQTVSKDAFANNTTAVVELYYAGNAPAALPTFTGVSSLKVYYREADQTWTEEYKAAYESAEWVPCCTVSGITANTEHAYVRDNNDVIPQTDGKNYPTSENMAYYAATCSVCGSKGKEYNDCIHCIDTADLQSDHPYNTETSVEWNVSMEGAEEIILTFDKKTQFETNYDDFFYIYDENGELYQKYINDQLAGKTVVVPGSSVTLKLTTDYSTDEWGFAVTRAYGTTHAWDDGVITKPAERDQTGTLKRTCKKCGESVEEVIPAPYIVCGDEGSIFWGITPEHVLELIPTSEYGISTGSYTNRETLNGKYITTAPWGEYEEYIEGLRVKKGITNIGSSTFNGLTKLKWAEIDDGVSYIESDAFRNCISLEQMELPENVTDIGWNAFDSCTSLKSIKIPKNLKICRSAAFSDCSSLSSVYIEDLLQWLNMKEGPRFYSSKSIAYYIDGELLEDLVIPQEITGIRNYAFYAGKSIKTVTFHEKVETIGESAFSGCENLELTRDKLPNYLKIIGSSAFSNCKKISAVAIPSSVINIADGAFRGCSGMTQCIFAKDIQIEKISSGTFSGCESLESVIIPLSVKTIEGNAFTECEKLKEINFQKENALTKIEYSAFSGCESLESITIPDGVTILGSDVFSRCKNLKEVEFAEESALSSIGSQAFRECESLENITIPSGVTSIGESAFCECDSLKEVEFAEGSVLTDIQSFVFSNCKSLDKITIPSGVTSLGSSAFWECSNLKEVEFTEGSVLTDIQSSAFSNCISLNKITIPSGVTSLGSNAFWECRNLKEIKFAKESKLTTIGSNVFYNTAFTKIVLPATVTNIENSAFSGCYSLQEIVFLGDFGLFGDCWYNSCKITYYACNDTWNSSEAQAFLNNSSGYGLVPNPIHMSEENTSLTPATCVTDGERSFVCDNCNQPFTEVLPATGHKLTVKEHKDATCIEKGYDIQVCSVCKEEFRTELEIDPSAHQYDEGKVIEPNCSRDGYTLYTCKLCGSTKREDYKPSTPHDYEDTVVKATCQMQGYTLHQCKNCDYSYTDSWTEPLEHDYETTVTAPTCTERGYTYYSCKNCGYSYRDNYVGATGHKYEKKVVPPTCIEEGYIENTCSVCGTSYRSSYREAAGHDYKKVVTAPTCTERGYTTYTCQNCDNVVVSDYRGVLGHSYEAEVTDSTCTAEGFTTYTCVTCGNSYVGDKTDKAPHKWDKGTVTKKTGYLENGTREFKCANCDASYTEDIPALKQTALKDCTITLSYRKTVYNGKEKTPEVTVKDGNGIVSEDNYTVTYADNQNAGTAKAIITAKGGDICITGEAERTFIIAKAKQSITAESADERIHVNATTEIQASGVGDISLETSDDDLITIKDMQIIGQKAGLALIKVTASGDSNYEAASSTVAVWVDENHISQLVIENRKTLENGDVEYDSVQKCMLCGCELKRTTKHLKNIDTEECQIQLDASVYTFDGQEVQPKVSVSLAGATLTEGKDYRLEYKDNDSVGEGTVTITGIGNYINSKDAKFQIVERLATGKITSISNAAKGMKVSWNKINGAEGYVIYRASGNGSYKAIKTITNVNTLSYTDTGATTNGSKYTYAVRGYKGSVKGDYTGKSAYCVTPSKLTYAKNTASKKMTVKWNRNTKVTGYQVSYKTGKTEKTVTIKSNKTLSTVIKSLKKGSTYSVKVRGYKTVSGVNYYSAWSSAKNVKVTK